jgi:ribosomal-protein-alanine N-acetyltransferase
MPRRSHSIRHDRTYVIAAHAEVHAACEMASLRRDAVGQTRCVELRTERLILRDYRSGDFDAVHAFASDPQVATFVDWGPNAPEDTRAFLGACVADQAVSPRTTYTLAVTEPGGPPFGSVGLETHGAHHADMGYVIRPERWGHGFASEAAAAILRFGFGPLGLHRIQSTCRPENLASVRVLEKIGMIREGYLHDHLLIRGQWHDSLLYASIVPTRMS